jgi:hypothetical protein
MWIDTCTLVNVVVVNEPVYSEDEVKIDNIFCEIFSPGSREFYAAQGVNIKLNKGFKVYAVDFDEEKTRYVELTVNGVIKRYKIERSYIKDDIAELYCGLAV